MGAFDDLWHQRQCLCLLRIDDLDVDATVAAIEDAGEDVWGVSVNVSQASSGKADPRLVLARTIEMAERTGRPILFGERWEPYDWPLADQLARLRPGDVVTYCLHVGPNGIVEDGKVGPESSRREGRW